MIGLKMFSESFKKGVVLQIQLGRLTQSEANRKYGIKGHSTILKWIRKFGETDLQYPIVMDYSKSEKKELIKRIKELERQLEDEQIRSFGYSKMIDIAEEQLKVSIRKKPDTKQPKK
jgi:transposase